MSWNSHTRITLSKPFDANEFAKVIAWFAEKECDAKYGLAQRTSQNFSSYFTFTRGDASTEVEATVVSGKPHSLIVTFHNDLDLATEFKLAF